LKARVPKNNFEGRCGKSRYALFFGDTMNNFYNNDTICAISTPPLMSAIGVIRVSGNDCIDIVGRCFDKPLNDKKGGTLTHGYIYDPESGKQIDEVVLSLFRAPASYTGEDVVEISCHGSVYILNRVIKLLISNGARQADRGEFTKRAFINGKLDTVKAEGIIDLIEAQTEKEASVAIEHLKGKLSKEINAVRDTLLGISAQIMAYIDYPDDEIEELEPENLYPLLKEQHLKVKRLLSSFEKGKLIKNGVSVCIAGKPNVGKSSLMNRLAGYDRSIVTEIEGTTRDIVEETVSIKGIKVKLSDTAGIRETDDRVEKIGVERAYSKLNSADIILAVFDGSRHLSEEDKELLSALSGMRAKKIAVINKTDLPEELEKNELFGFDKTVRISSLENYNLDGLADAMCQLFEEELELNDTEIITNERQFQCLSKAEAALSQCIGDVLLPPDVLEVCIEDAIDALSVVLGKSVGEDILQTIFSRFCVGK
jgi:tRNA modification GTPase